MVNGITAHAMLMPHMSSEMPSGPYFRELRRPETACTMNTMRAGIVVHTEFGQLSTACVCAMSEREAHDCLEYNESVAAKVVCVWLYVQCTIDVCLTTTYECYAFCDV